MPIDDLEMLGLSACPPKEMAGGEPPIDQVHERLSLQSDALGGLLERLAECICEHLVSQGASLQKIERHLDRLVRRELKDVGINLSRIADYLLAIVGTQVNELTPLIAYILRQPIPPPLPLEIEAEPTPPEIIPAPSAPSFLQVEPAVEPEPEIIPAPPELPQFEKEVSVGVGGETFPFSGAKLPAGELPLELVVDWRETA